MSETIVTKVYQSQKYYHAAANNCLCKDFLIARETWIRTNLSDLKIPDINERMRDVAKPLEHMQTKSPTKASKRE